ncbi:hypothetical protein HMPREF9566_01181 [Cutibacterium acnes HL045PA1]|nr:hypothetical protein HMPREF9567_02327 [Cutibacterium acnes HL013PA1]EFT20911.1 hypothetical protein HMPREF9566_01181 [Cutibacterium acnes HL045PA1]EGE89997.1 hypothetical protein HMPREF9571_02597 [Cutibacterium acnes HL043PA2]
MATGSHPPRTNTRHPGRAGAQLHREELLGLDAHGMRHCHTLVV